MFERLKKEIKKHHADEARKIAFFIKRGFYPDWAEEHRDDKDRGIKRHATAATLKAYQNGKITRAQAVEKATARAVAATTREARRRRKRLMTTPQF